MITEPASAKLVSKTVSRLSGKQVLITGTSGFLGKIVLEKLLRAVPDIGGVHLLIRGNARHPTAPERFMAEIAGSSVFERLRSELGADFDDLIETKVHCITGEITQERFGLSAEEFKSLAGEIDVVISSAASVNFREELDKALAINCECLRNLVAFTKAGRHIPVIQVSTCYVNGKNRGAAMERIVTPAGAHVPRNEAGYFEVEALIRLLQDKIEDVRSRYKGEALARKLVDLGIREANHYGWDDTYTFTKWLGEQVLMKGLRGQSLTIVRPSIIESAIEEPMPGWIEGVKVADAIILAYAREKVSLFPGRRKSITDVIPADLVGIAILLSVAEALGDERAHRIYQACTGSRNPVTLGEFIDHIVEASNRDHKLHEKLYYRRPRRPFVAVNRKLFDRVVGGVRVSLALADRALKLIGQPREIVALRNLDVTRSLATIFGAYTAPDYVFHNDRLLALAERMGAADKVLFPVDPIVIDWKNYIQRIHLAGLNRYALRENNRYRLKNRKLKKAA